MKKENIIQGIISFGVALVFFGLLVFTFTKVFDGRTPFAIEFLPLVSIVLVSLAIMFKD